MTYDFIAILDQDVPRCRSWVRFMGPKCFTRSWGLGWGGHRRTYLSLTSVGSGSARTIAGQDSGDEGSIKPGGEKPGEPAIKTLLMPDH